MVDSTRIALQCPCGTKLAVPASAAGKKTKCPKCTKVLAIELPREARAVAKNPTQRATTSLERPRAEVAARERPIVERPAVRIARPSPPPPAFAEPVPDEDPGYEVAFDALVEESAAPPLPTVAQIPCPQCGAGLAAGAVVCISCGYDLRSGKRLKTKRHKESKVGEAAKTAGRFVMGAVLSGVGSAIGAIIWCVVVFVTYYEIGWIAWGVGFLAGVGMKLGYGEESETAGFSAAGIAIGGILLAKVAIYLIVSAAANEAFTFMELFGPWDLLFFFLAAATAYKIGNGSYNTD